MSKSALKPLERLVGEIKTLIEQSRRQVAVTVNAAMTTLYWQIGRRINQEVLKEQRAEYGRQIVVLLARQLETEYGRGWSEKQLRHCLHFAETFPDEAIVSALRRQLSWTHIKTLMYIDDELKRLFYIEMCKLEKWGTRILQERVNSMLYERTAISKKPEETIKNELDQLGQNGQITPDLVFRDPYFLDFLDLKDTYSEKTWSPQLSPNYSDLLLSWGRTLPFWPVRRESPLTIATITSICCFITGGSRRRWRLN